MAYLFAKDVV
jgi:hypothetical protein